MSLEAVRKMAEPGVVANMQPAWLWLDAIAGGGSDHMRKIGGLRSINPYNPFLGIRVTLTRRARWLDEPLHPEQAITREQAIRF